MEHLINPPPWGGEDAGDRLFPLDGLVFENHSVGTHAEAVESFQFLGEGFDVALFLGKTLDRTTQGVTGLGRQLPQILHHLVGDANGDHRVSRAEAGW